MLRITTWRMVGTPPPDLTPGQGLQAFQDLCTTIRKEIKGYGRLDFFFGNGGIVTVGEPDSYAAADAILQTPAVQGAVGKVLSLGYGIVDDQFLLAPSQVMPFTQRASTVPAALSRN